MLHGTYTKKYLSWSEVANAGKIVGSFPGDFLWWLVMTKCHQGVPSPISLLSSRKLFGTRKERIPWLKKYLCIPCSLGNENIPFSNPPFLLRGQPPLALAILWWLGTTSSIGAVSCLSYIPNLGNDSRASCWGVAPNSLVVVRADNREGNQQSSVKIM